MVGAVNCPNFYEGRPRFYRRFVVQKQFLESGTVGYQCVDNVGEAARDSEKYANRRSYLYEKAPTP